MRSSGFGLCGCLIRNFGPNPRMIFMYGGMLILSIMTTLSAANLKLSRVVFGSFWNWQRMGRCWLSRGWVFRRFLVVERIAVCCGQMSKYMGCCQVSVCLSKHSALLGLVMALEMCMCICFVLRRTQAM